MVHKIDGPGATSEGTFTAGDPNSGIPATWIMADWLNMVQGELVGFVEAAGLVPTKGNNGQLLSAFEILGGGGAGNVLTNSLFRHWQRRPSGLGILTSRTMLSDRWILDPGDGGGGGHFPEDTTLGDLFGQSSGYHGELPARVCNWNALSPSVSNPHATEQRIPDVRTLSGTKVVVSFFAYADVATTITPKLTQHFGDGGSASADVVTTGTAISIPGTSVPAFYQQVLTLPSVAGKTIDLSSDPASWLEFRLELAHGVSGLQLRIWNVRLESGTVPRPNLWLPEIVDELDCKRYYETNRDILNSTTTYFGSAGSQAGQLWVFDYTITNGLGSIVYGMERALTVPKIRIPTVRWSHNTNIDQIRYSGGPSGSGFVDIQATYNETHNNSGHPVLISTHGLTTGQYTMEGWYEADAELPI